MTAQPHPRPLTGPHPGQLDQTQPLRVLRHPDASLSFAAFHPQAASNVPPYNPLDGSSNPKRIVVETHPGGFSHWRFVPRARLAEGVSDEGSWPRLVDVLGIFTMCDQDQWDIHKLDPFYDCFVPAPPHHPTIRAKVAPASSFPSSSTSSRSSIFAEGSQKKRRLTSPPSSIEEEAGHSPKKRKHAIHVVHSSDDESEVEATGDSTAGRTAPRTYVPGRRVRGRRGGMHRVPVFRTARANFSANAQSNVLHDETMRSTTPPREPPQTTTTTSASKRRKDDTSPVTPEDNKPSKRARTGSPDAVRRKATAAKLKERVRARTEDFMRRMNAERDARRDARNQSLMEDIIAEMPEEHTTQPNGEQEQEQEQQDGEEPTDEEQQRLSEALEELRVHEELIAESRRKIAELERDRPLWEAAAHARERQEREEEEERRAQAERARREAEREQERARQAAAAEAEAARRRAEAQRARWAQGPWTSQRALERYRVLCASFDEAAKPLELTFEDVPWPTLHRPYTFGPEDIDWSAVETFFQTIRGHMRAQDYRVFVQNSHRRFHPDRWSARGLLTAVKDEHARGMIEVAANTVAQALTPLWREARGQ